MTYTVCQILVNVHKRVLKESDDLIEMALNKSQNGIKGFEPHRIIMEATVNTGFSLTVGYSMKQGTPKLCETVIELEHVLSELISFSNHKLIFILIPRCLRKLIPLKYWPREYSYQIRHTVSPIPI